MPMLGLFNYREFLFNAWKCW